MVALRLTPSGSITIGLISLILALFWLLDLTLGVFPNETSSQRSVREKVSTHLAVQVSSILSRGDQTELTKMLDDVRTSSSDIVSLAVREEGGRILTMSGPHTLTWQSPGEGKSTLDFVQLPILRDGTPWAFFEITYLPSDASGIWHYIKAPGFYVPLLIIVIGGLVFYLYLRRVLSHLDPSQVIPDRVSTALDTLTEAVMIVDKRGRLMLINDAFKDLHPAAPDAGIGTDISAIDWLNEHIEGIPPWQQVNNNMPPVKRQPLKIRQSDGKSRHLLVNASPVKDAKDQYQGCLVTMQDITAEKVKNAQLVKANSQLQSQKKVIEAKNRELQELANIDQLTGLLNRRAFFDRGEKTQKACCEQLRPLAVIMCDIDHFKSINDNHGHPVGDEAIRMVSSTIARSVRNEDILGRYGGEEFCVVVPDLGTNGAMKLAERIRANIERQAGPGVRSVPGMRITSSFGVAMCAPGTDDLLQLIEQADQALYESKQNGRNCVNLYKPADT